MIRIDLQAPIDSRAGLEAFAVARALGHAGAAVTVLTEGGCAPRRFLAHAAILPHAEAAPDSVPWPPPSSPYPDLPVAERAFWKGEAKFEDVAAFASRNGWQTLEACRGEGLEFLGVDTEHEVNALEQLLQASIAVFVSPHPGCLVTPAEAMAAGCVVLASDDWPLPRGARHGEHLWVASEAGIRAALHELVDDGQRTRRRRLRDAGFALAAGWRDGIVGPVWRNWIQGRWTGCA